MGNASFEISDGFCLATLLASDGRFEKCNLVSETKHNLLKHREAWNNKEQMLRDMLATLTEQTLPWERF